jgi:PKD repeat protein
MATPESGEAPLEVKFDYQMTGGAAPYAFEWDFENDGKGDSSREAPRHTYTKGGVYTVRLTVRDTTGASITAYKTIRLDKERIGLPRKAVEWTRLDLMGSDIANSGDSIQGTVTFTNNDNYRMKDASVTVLIIGLDSRKKIGPIDIEPGEQISRVFTLDIPQGAKPGVYELRAVISDDNIRRVKHRDIIIT